MSPLTDTQDIKAGRQGTRRESAMKNRAKRDNGSYRVSPARDLVMGVHRWGWYEVSSERLQWGVEVAWRFQYKTVRRMKEKGDGGTVKEAKVQLRHTLLGN